MADFFAMGGHGLYVWGSFGVAAILMVAEVIIVLKHKRTLMQRLGRMIRMNSEVRK